MLFQLHQFALASFFIYISNDIEGEVEDTL